jgi:MFS family permease
VALGNAVAAAAPSLGVLIGARALVGAAAGGLVPGALVLLADEHSGPSQARKQAALIAALGGGTALTALVGLAGNANGWRAVSALTAALSVVLIPLFGLLSRITRSGRAGLRSTASEPANQGQAPASATWNSSGWRWTSSCSLDERWLSGPAPR